MTPRKKGAWLPPRRADAHKGDAGHVLIVAGSRGMLGAGRLCAWGALRAGAGLVTWAVPSGDYPSAAAGGPWEAMTLPLLSSGGAFAPGAARKAGGFVAAHRISSVALGPGLSSGAARFAREFLSLLKIPVVADADALNALAARPVFRRAPWVITPHPGEAARLLGVSVPAVQKDRRGAAKELSRRFGAVAVLKGAGTVVTDGRSVFVNDSGNPGMATGGMGDVLSGVIAALIPQVRAEDVHEACFRAAVLGVRAHGLAGDSAARSLGPIGIAATDVAARVPAALKRFQEELSC